MDEIEYKLQSNNSVLISHAISKLFESIKKKKCDRQTDHISKIAEFKLLLTKVDSMDVTVSMSVCQALIALAENGLWDINEALSTFTSSISTMKNHMVTAMTISRLLILDLQSSTKDNTIYSFTLHAPQHPFIVILNQDKYSWQTILNEMTFIMNHHDPRVKENGVKMLRAVFLYILCNPSLNSVDCCMQQIWQLLIKSKHSTCVQTEILLWSCTAEKHACINTNYRILELTEKALIEGNNEYCTALLPMIASLIIQLLKQGSDPRSNFNILLVTIDRCDKRIGNLMLTLMAEVVVLCPPIYLYSILQICIMIGKKMSCSDIFMNVLRASILKWMAYPSVLCSDALNMARDLANGIFVGTKRTDDNETIFSSRLFTVFAQSDPYVQLYTELVHCLSIWKSSDILLWLQNMSHVSIYLKDKCKLLIAGLLLNENEPYTIELCCNILIDASRENKSFASHVLPLILHKLTKCKTATELKYLLLVIPELAITKENVPIITYTLNTLLSGEKRLKYFTIELYLKALRREQRCYRFISTAIIRLMKNDSSWYSDATCARAMKYICENCPEHGEMLVPLLSQILNRSTDTNGGTASALALCCISALCKASTIDICSTWRVLAPKMEKEKRTIVLESLCQLFADVTSYPPTGYLEEYDQLIDNIISKLWKYATSDDIKVIDAAFKALSSYHLEQLTLKTLPERFKRSIVLPAVHAKKSIDTATNLEDLFPYIPGTCWIQVLENINKIALSSAGNLLISFVTEEVSSFRSGIYVWPQGEPQNFKYLPEKCVIRAVGEYLRKSDKSDPNKQRIITECLRIFAQKYPKPLPNINWNFLKDTIDLSAEAKRYTLSIACHHASISLSAKSFIEDYLLKYKSINDTNFFWENNEHTVLYSNLEDLCQAVQPNIIKPFLETTLEYVMGKINVDNKDSIQLFNCIMCSYAQALKNQEICHANSTLLSTILDKLLDRIDLTCDHFHSYFIAAVELSTKHLERMTSPKVWWDITADKLKNAITIRAELVLKKPTSESPLTWLNEIIDETAVSTSSVQTYFLQIMQKVLTEMQLKNMSSNWILELMTQIQGLLMESSSSHNDKILFYFDVLFISVVSLSGVDSMLMKQKLMVESQDIRTQLFPQALAIISDRGDLKHAIPQVMEWLNYMRTSAISTEYKSTFHRSLICLRHNPHYKDVWIKYLSIQTDSNGCCT
ncbi:focadhesin [Xylocopa sonorina]|uniref:focadhesin n=1 Tax=Xylocopa sonorina TaxID=1818115 RepID=UPI00403ACA6C